MSSGASERIAWAREKSAFQVQLDESSQVAEDATAKLIEERTQHAEALAEADRRRETELADMRKKSLERDAQLLGDILHPTSYILHPTSYILHLTSYILHLTSYRSVTLSSSGTSRRCDKSLPQCTGGMQRVGECGQWRSADPRPGAIHCQQMGGAARHVALHRQINRQMCTLCRRRQMAPRHAALHHRHAALHHRHAASRHHLHVAAGL